MKQVSVRDLRYAFKKIKCLLRQGKEIQITKRGHVIARLLPESLDRKATRLPDFPSRMRAAYGERTLEVSGADLIAQDRSRY